MRNTLPLALLALLGLTAAAHSDRTAATAVPYVANITLNTRDFRTPRPGNLGFVPWVRTICVLITDPQSTIRHDSVQVSLTGDHSGEIHCAADMTPFAPGHWVRIRLRADSLRSDDYTLRISATNTLNNHMEASYRFSTAGIVTSAAAMPILYSSEPADKPQAESAAPVFPGESLGDYVVYGVNVKRAGGYGVTICFTQGPQYGLYRVRLDDDACPEMIDGYAPVLRPGRGTISFGPVTLTAGQHRLRFDLIGKNPQAEKRYLAVTEIVLRPLLGRSPLLARPVPPSCLESQ